MRGITEETLRELVRQNHNDHEYINPDEAWDALEELTPWHPMCLWQDIATAPKDREIAVYAPSYHELESLVSKCQWHDSAGFCIDELRTPTHWCELPADPKWHHADTNNRL